MLDLHSPKFGRAKAPLCYACPSVTALVMPCTSSVRTTDPAVCRARQLEMHGHRRLERAAADGSNTPLHLHCPPVGEAKGRRRLGQQRLGERRSFLVRLPSETGRSDPTTLPLLLCANALNRCRDSRCAGCPIEGW